MAIKISETFADELAGIGKTLLAGGLVRIFGGSVPADADAADSVDLLAEFTLPSPAFGSIADGEMDANTIDPSTWLADGTATHFRAYGGSPAGCLIQGSVAVTSADMIVNSTTAVNGGVVTITSWHYTQNKS